MSRGLGTTQRKILLLLLGGVALGMSGSPSRYFRILKHISREWRDINRAALWRSIRSLYRSKLIRTVRNTDGSRTLVLSEKGRERALTYRLEEMRIPVPAAWDKKWHLVLCDIPQKRSRTRDAFRVHLKQIGFLELQKSVFVCPYPCQDEIDFLVELYDIRRHVRMVIADTIDTELHLKQKFDLKI